MSFVPCLRPDRNNGGLLLDETEALHIIVGRTTVQLTDLAKGDDDADLPGGEPHFIGLLDGRPVYAHDAEPDAGAPLMALYGRVDDLRWTIAGRAVQLVEWARTHRFCGRCGTENELAPGERAMRCPGCKLLAFPRLSPAIIVLVTREDGKALLARGAQFPVPMYSCLAGFVEPGESMEEAVHREVKEEVGIDIKDVTYWGSQPWPFPHSLMLGFRASYAGGDLVLDPKEILDAGWYGADELPTIPPGMSIARRLIDDWLAAS